MHDLRDIWVSFRGKFQVEEINSDAQTIHSFYKYMRKIRAKWGNPRIEEENFNPFSFVYYFLFKLFISFQME
jgi:hypothetical protein